MSRLLIEDLEVRFSTTRGIITAVDRVTLLHEKGRSLALVGETGSGKSTLALAVLNLLPPTARLKGRILFNDRDILQLAEPELSKIRGQKIAIVLQNASLALNPIYTVGHQISETAQVFSGLNKKKALRMAAAHLRRLGFSHPEEQLGSYPFQFSEGMNQRVLIAMALSCQPNIIIADEPTQGLDERAKAEVVQELRSAHVQYGTRLLLVSHDLPTARRLTDRIAVMYGGEIVEEANTEEFLSHPHHPYSKGLISSLPENGFIPIPGQSPSLLALPQGCRFSPRCRDIMAQCSRIHPSLIETQGRKIRCLLYQ